MTCQFRSYIKQNITPLLLILIDCFSNVYDLGPCEDIIYDNQLLLLNIYYLLIINNTQTDQVSKYQYLGTILNEEHNVQLK